MQDYLHGKPIPYSAHITSSATTTVISTDTLLYSINVTVTGAGTTWVIKIQDKQGTPRVAYTNTGTGVAVGTVNLSFPQGIPMVGGIDIVTAGTAGTLDVFLAYA